MYLINLKTGQSVSMQPKDHRGADQFFFDYRAPNDTDGSTSASSNLCFPGQHGSGRSAGIDPGNADGSSISGSSSESGSESADLEELKQPVSARKRLKFMNAGML